MQEIDGRAVSRQPGPCALMASEFSVGVIEACVAIGCAIDHRQVDGKVIR